MTDSDKAVQPAPESDLTGRQLGDYRLLRRLGRGGMADVYLAEQSSLLRQVAFKVLKRNLADDNTSVKRFHNEAQAAASLVHANIVQIHEVGCIDGIHFIAQEYVQGQNLRQFLARQGPVDLKLAVAVLRQVASALHKAGQAGIIHRDVKPENILLSSNGEVKVADFGLARVARPDGAVDLTQVGITMGTPLYMSPEQVEGRQIDPRSDIYSFGVTCYQMFTGQPPFQAETALGVAVQHLRSAPRPLEELRPDVPLGLCNIVHKMLAKDPDDRHQNAAELLGHLKQLAAEAGDADWSAAMGDWSTTETIALADVGNEATGRLDALMKTAGMAAQGRRHRWRSAALILIAVIAAILLGGAIAWTTREPYLLHTSGEQTASHVERRETAEAQYIYAVMLGTEEALMSVSEYFKPEESRQNQYYARRAKQQLARLLLKKDQLDRAMAEFTELAELEPTEEHFRAFGLAGQAIVLGLKGDHQASAAKIASVYPLRRRLDPQMSEQIERLSQKNREALQKSRENH